MSQPKVEEDLLPSILAETVPEVAKRVLSSTREPMTSLSQIGGQERCAAAEQGKVQMQVQSRHKD
eukprot:1610514-Amphidinium_carterae.2